MPSSAATPQLRADLEPFAMAENGRTVVVLGDPVSGRYFRLREVEGTILSLLDGRQDLESVHQEVCWMFPGRRLPLEAVTAFVEQVGRLGLLEGVKPVPPRRSLVQRVLFLKLSLLNPDRMLGQLYQRVAFLYQPWALALAALIVLAATVVAMTNLDDLRRSFMPPGSWAGVLLLWFSVSLITLIHELGHGLTCKHFGARASGFGLLFIYFLPCFYCDVSGAWTLRRRSQRLWVGAAGLCFQFVAGSVALLVWRVVDPTSLLGRACLAMVSVCGADALLNLIPLIRLDGYYLLSDWLEIPNLRGRALGYVGARLRRWLLGLPGAPGEARGAGGAFWGPVPGPRQARIFLVYGTLAGLFAAAMMSWSAFSLYRWFYGRFGGIGVIALGVLTVLLFAAPVGRLVGLWLTALRSGTGSASGAAPGARPQAPGSDEGQSTRRSASIQPGSWSLAPGAASTAPVPSSSRPPVAASPRPAVTPSPRFRAVALAAVLPAGAAVLALGHGTLNVVAPCRLEALRSVPVRVARSGVLAELRYREGDWVRDGATIGILDTFALKKELTALESRANMLRVEAEIARRQALFVGVQRESEAAHVAAQVPPAKIALEEVAGVQPFRVAEAENRVQEARATLTAAEQKANRLRADVDRMVRGDLPPALQVLQERVEKASVGKEYAVREANRLGRLQAEGAVALLELDRARARAAVLAKEEEAATSELVASQKQLREEASDAGADVDRARAAYRAAQQIQRQVARQGAPARVAAARQEIGARQSAAHAAAVLQQEKSLKSAEVELKQLERDRVLSQIALVKKRIDQSCLIAHTSGVVATPHLDQRLGRQFAVGEAVCVLDLTGQVQVRVFVDERDVGEITRGAPVQLKIAAFPDRLFTGQVREIVRRSVAANGRNSYEVRLRVLNPSGQLMPGMTGWAKIGCGRRSWGALLARRVLRYVRTEAWSWF